MLRPSYETCRVALELELSNEYDQLDFQDMCFEDDDFDRRMIDQLKIAKQRLIN